VSGLRSQRTANSQKRKAKSEERKAAPHSYHVPRYNGFSSRSNLACAYLVPREIVNDGSWPHPSRLPLGAGWTGTCRASGHELAVSDAHIRQFCNLGYATACPQLPPSRDWDAVRFSVARTSQEQVTICFVCELAHAPIEHGELTFDLMSEVWLNAFPDPRVLTLANCYLQAYRARQSASSHLTVYE
jgi:hypothetical protein